MLQQIQLNLQVVIELQIYVNESEANKSSGSYIENASVGNTVIQQVGVGRNSGVALVNILMDI